MHIGKQVLNIFFENYSCNFRIPEASNTGATNEFARFENQNGGEVEMCNNENETCSGSLGEKCRKSVKVLNMKMNFNTGGTWHQVGQ